MQGLSFLIRFISLFILILLAPFGTLATTLSPIPIDSICDLSGDAKVVGLAINSASKDPVYCEYHFDEYQGDVISRSIVKYIDINKQQIAEKDIDFTVMPLAPNVVQRDARQGELRTMTYLPDEQQYLLEYQKNSDAKKSSATVNNNPSLDEVADAGFDLFIKKSWSPLLFGQSVDLSFLSPVHTRGFTLKIRLDNNKTCGGINYTAEQSVCFSVTPTSSLLKFFAKPLHLLYSRDTQQLEVFSGAVNLVDDQGVSQTASIYYWHQP